MGRMRAFGKRFGYLFGVFAAALVFASWLVGNTLLERSKSATERMKAIVSAQREYYKYSQLTLQGRNMDKMLTGIENNLNMASMKQLPEEQRRIVELTTDLQWVQVAASDIEADLDFAIELAALAAKVSLPKETSTKLQEARLFAQSIQSDYWRLRDEYRSHQTNLLKEPGISTTRVTRPQLEQLEPLVRSHVAAINRLLKTKEQLGNDLLRISSKISEVASASASVAERRASIAQYAVFAFYVVGTCFAIWGKILETKDPTTKTAVGDDIPET